MSASRMRRPRTRRGVALLAALWLVVMIATAGLQFALVARERRQLGLTSADRLRDVAALEGALAEVHARLEQAAGRMPIADGGRFPRSASRRPRLMIDPWQDLAARLAQPLRVGSQEVTATPVDLGTVVNVNLASEAELAVLIGSVTQDAALAAAVSQAILDWRDEDGLQRAAGAEAERYRRAGLAVRPANGPFAAVDDLLDVWGMTPEVFGRVRPYLTVDGSVRRINVNAAPAPVLRTLPGMTEPLLATLLALRGRGRRVESVPALLTAVRGAGRLGPGEADALARALTDAVTLDTRDVAVEFAVSEPRSPQPARLVAVLHRDGDGTTDIRARRW